MAATLGRMGIVRQAGTALRALLLGLLGGAGAAAHAADAAIPKVLDDWRGWVLQGEEYRACPWIASAGQGPTGRNDWVCAWPGRLSLQVDARGGDFAQRWEVQARGWVKLPGSARLFPREVTVNDRAAAVVLREGVPQLLLPAGSASVRGRFEWGARPESIDVPLESGLVELEIDGTAVRLPSRSGTTLLLGSTKSAGEPASFDLQVYRLFVDSIPAILQTQLQLRATGASREIVLGPVLPEGFVPISLDSVLPARVEPDGRLRVQLRPGTYTIALAARAVGTLQSLQRPPSAEGWPAQEIWSFQGIDRLRVATLEGGDSIDAAQAGVPPEWHAYPAWRVEPTTTLTLVEQARGLAGESDNRLSLHRSLWLDFDGRGYTAIDAVTGELRSGWRLDMTAPWALGSASSNGEPMLVTKGPGEELTGVELRTPSLALEAISRAEHRGSLPGTGWNSRFDGVSGTLFVPPGHRLVAAIGVDQAPGAWLERWGLWSLFGIVIVSAAAGWMFGPVLGVLAFIALLLTYQESPQLIWLWGNLLAAIAIARATPAGRWHAAARSYRLASFVVLALVLVPFAWSELRLAIHPQLDLDTGRQHEPQYDMAADAAVAAGEAVMPEVAMEMPASAPPMSKRFDDRMSNVIVTAQQRAPERYAPGTMVQAGPGVPEWRYRAYDWSWSGPVEPTQEARFIVARPFVLSLWRVIGIVLVALLFAALASGSGSWLAPARFERWRQRFARERVARGTAASMLVVVAAATVASLAPAPAAAQMPDPALLGELRTRLTKPPACLPSCADLGSATATIDGDRLSLSIEASALDALAVPVPTASRGWRIESIEVDGAPSVAARRGVEEALWVPLGPGRHRIVLSGSVAGTDSLQLIFPWSPKSMSVSSNGWSVAGVTDGRLPGGSLDFSRDRRSAAGASAGAAPDSAAPEFPPFVRLVRDFSIGIETTIGVRVERVSPAQSAFSVEVPLLEGESVLDESIAVTPRRTAVATFAPGQGAIGWRSALPDRSQFALTAPADTAPIAEVWRFQVGPQWHAGFDGLAATLPEPLDASQWTYEFHPRPGETLEVSLTRPEAVPGSTLAIDSVEREVEIGQRSTVTTLTVHYRATQGGRQAVKLPADHRVDEVQIDGNVVPLRPENGALSIPVQPGSHIVSVQATEARGIAWRATPASLDVGAPVSNLTTTLALPANRWALFAWGPGIGPAILYWSELVAFLLFAWFVGHHPRSPLRAHEWVLLGLGLSTQSWGVLALVAIWLFAMQWRAGWQPVHWRRWTFLGVQGALALLTVVAVSGLLFSGIRDGLLSSPDMGITGEAGARGAFAWFLDRSGGELPQPTVISVPMWIYKALIFAWAVWVAFALLRWLRLAWQAWSLPGPRAAPKAPVTA